MKKIVLLFCIFCSVFSVIQAQEQDDLYYSNLKSLIKYSDLATINKISDFKSYLSKDGAVYKVGDKLKIGLPSSSKSFAFIQAEGSSARHYLGVDASGHLTEIQRIYVRGNKRAGYAVYFDTKGYTVFDTYIIDIENAIAAKEIKSSGMTSDEALAELKRSKDKLDLGLITQEKYDSIKLVLMKYIK